VLVPGVSLAGQWILERWVRPHPRTYTVLGVAIASLLSLGAGAWRQSGAPADGAATLERAQRLFYNGNYEASAALALTLETSERDGLAARELRTSALHFQIRRALGDPEDKERAFKECRICEPLATAFFKEIGEGQAIARAQLLTNPANEEPRFFLGKLDLNYVWLQLGTLGHRTGWNEFREARRSMDTVLKQNPNHTRARVARAWIDYIVDTKVPRGFRWILGGGNKKRGLAVVRAAAEADSGVFDKAEAAFGLWEMQIRERDFTAAAVTARALARGFPDNQELVRFLETTRSGQAVR